MWQPVARRALDELDYASFLEQYVFTGTPVLLTGADWPAFARWSVGDLRRRAACDQEADLSWVDESGVATDARATVGDALDQLARISAGEDIGKHRLYLRSWTYAARNPTLSADIVIPPHFAHDVSHLMGYPLQWIYVGADGSSSATHLDLEGSSAWLAVIAGRKRWRLVAAADVDQLPGWPDRLPELFDIEPTGVRAWEATQEPGEIMWVPSHAPHGVRNEGFSIAVTHNYMDFTNLHALYAELASRPPIAHGPITPPRVLYTLVLRQLPVVRALPEGELLCDWLRERLEGLARGPLGEGLEPTLALLER